MASDYPWWFFSLARYNPGGPTYYGEVVRLPADRYLQRSVLGIIAAASTFLLVLLLVLPIIKYRIQSVITAVNSLSIGVGISLCLISPEWLVGRAVVQSAMNYYSTKVHSMEIGIHIGLASANITLISLPWTSGNLSIPQESYFYNERIKMFTPELLEPSKEKADTVGLPIPLLSAIHFLTSATDEFCWSQDIMEAGYHSYLSLSFALAVWFLAQLLIAAIPRYSCYAFIVIGILMVGTNIIYFHWVQLESHFPPIFISGEFIELDYGMCFWVCLVMGVWACIYGFTLSVYDLIYPDKFLTIFDIDYDHKRALAAANRYNHLAKNRGMMEEEYEHTDTMDLGNNEDESYVHTVNTSTL